MPPEEPQERHYDINKLNFLFAVSSIVLLLCIGWMFWHDYDRAWKGYQKEFRALEIEKTRVKYDAQVTRLKDDPKYAELTTQYEAARKAYQEKCPDLSGITKELGKRRAQNDLANQEYRFVKAELDAAKYDYEEALAHRAPELDEAAGKYQRLSQQTEDLRQNVEQSQAQLNESQNKLDECGKDLQELERQKRQIAGQKELLERKLEKIDPAQMSLTNEIADLVRDLPGIDFANPQYKIEQVVLKDITEDVNYTRVPKVDRCVTCHTGISNPDYQNAAQPFRTHPNLELFVSKDSAHPLEEFGCTVCHSGRGRGTDFVSAAHTPASEEQRKEWEKKYQWHKLHHWEAPMYPKPYVEAGCFKCHSGQSAIKGAEKLNLGLNLIEKSGCYACHLIDKYKDWPKPGPDLTRLPAKANKEWIYRWILDPPSFRHNTRMPSFYGLSNNSDPESLERGQQEVHAMVHYLWTGESDFPLNEMPNWGDAQRGEEIVAAVGCLGCHEIQRQKTEAPTTRETLLRQQGPNLIGLANKTSKTWLYNWLKDPKRYHPATLMPNLRLSDQEAADVAAYLAKDENKEFEQRPIPPVNEDILNEIVHEFLSKTMPAAETKAKLGQMQLDDKLQFAGQKLIAHYGCYSCHNIKGFENAKPIGTELTQEGSKAVDKLDFGFIHIDHSPQAWFTQKLKDPRSFDKDKIRAFDERLRMPDFRLTHAETEAVVTALLGFVKDRPEQKMMPATPRQLSIEEGEKIVRQFNCQGCHILQGEGGAIRPVVVDWLVKYHEKEEAEAQALINSFSPPNLIGEGKKVQAAWLFNFLHEPVTIRPWLKARMPTYGFPASHLNALVKYFNALDAEEFPFSEPVDPASLSPGQREAGHKLFSKDYFNCAQCHIVGDQMPTGEPESWAPDFALSRIRLKPEWIAEWIRDPQELLPGTKMPTFFDPQSFEESGPPDILDGDENRQIKALRDYLWTISDSAQKAPDEKQEPVVSPETGDSLSPPSPAL